MNMESVLDPLTKTGQAMVKRLVVIITDCLVNNTDLAYAIYWMATRENLDVIYLVMVDDYQNLLPVSRNMATMRAVTSGNNLSVEVRIVETRYWVDSLRSILSTGDVIVCQEEQTVENGLFRVMTLGEYLSAHMNYPVRVLSGYARPVKNHTKKWVNDFFVLLGFLAILALFTWLQISIDQVLDGDIAKILIGFALCIEVGAIWTWYRLTNQ